MKLGTSVGAALITARVTPDSLEHFLFNLTHFSDGPSGRSIFFIATQG
jgi:hypothetical protein